MKKIFLLIAVVLFVFSLHAQQEPDEWPVLKHYDQEHLLNIASKLQSPKASPLQLTVTEKLSLLSEIPKDICVLIPSHHKAKNVANLLFAYQMKHK